MSKLSEDLIYFVEDDYIHEVDSITEMFFTYERIASLTNKELIICPADYPYLYTQAENTKVFLEKSIIGEKLMKLLYFFNK